MSNDNIKTWIARVRGQLGLTLADIASACGISWEDMRRWQQGCDLGEAEGTLAPLVQLDAAAQWAQAQGMVPLRHQVGTRRAEDYGTLMAVARNGALKGLVLQEMVRILVRYEEAALAQEEARHSAFAEWQQPSREEREANLRRSCWRMNHDWRRTQEDN